MVATIRRDMKIGDLVRVSERELDDLMWELDLESRTEITKDYSIGVVTAHKPGRMDPKYPWTVHWFPLNQTQDEKSCAIEIVARA